MKKLFIFTLLANLMMFSPCMAEQNIESQTVLTENQEVIKEDITPSAPDFEYKQLSEEFQKIEENIKNKKSTEFFQCFFIII